MNDNKETVKNIALKAGIWYVVSSVMVKMVSVITTPIFTRILTTDEYGTVSTFNAWCSLLIVICSLSLTNSIGRAKFDFPGKLNEYIGSLQILSAAFTAVLGIIAIIFLDFFSKILGLDKILTMLLIVYLFFSPAITFYQSGCRYKYEYKQNIAIAWYTALSTVTLSLILIFMSNGDKAVSRTIGTVFPTVALSICIWIKAFKNGNIKPNISYWKYGLSISLSMMFHTISMNILSQSDLVMISKICGTSSTALYSLVRNFALLLTIIIDAVNQGWLPWFHDTFFKGDTNSIKKNTRYIVMLECYIGLACMAFGPEAIYILGGEQYIEAVSCLIPMVLGVVCHSTYTHYINIELHKKKTIYASLGTMFAAVLNIFLNFICIPRFGYSVAAYTTFASYFALLIIHYIITRRILKVKLYDDKFMFGAILVISLISILINISYSNFVFRYLLIIVGLIAFLFSFRLFIKSFVKGKLENRK